MKNYSSPLARCFLDIATKRLATAALKLVLPDRLSVLKQAQRAAKQPASSSSSSWTW
jgi:hypothetical protein